MRKNNKNLGGFGHSTVLRTLPLLGSLNTAYTAHFVRLNFGKAETSYMLEPLGETAALNKSNLLEETR